MKLVRHVPKNGEWCTCGQELSQSRLLTGLKLFLNSMGGGAMAVLSWWSDLSGYSGNEREPQCVFLYVSVFVFFKHLPGDKKD